MEIFFTYIKFSISVTVISWLVGMIMTALIRRTRFYNEQLSNLNFIESEKANRIIGIGIVKWIVKNTFFKFLNQKLKISRRTTIADLQILRAEMTKSEIDHLFAFAFVMAFVVIKIMDEPFAFGLTILVVNLLMNLYPSLLQQQNKRRIDEVLRRTRKY